jgi:nucleotide-binding universal stress UspA family protein
MVFVQRWVKTVYQVNMRILLSVDGSCHSDNAVDLFLGQLWPADSHVKIVTVSPDFRTVGRGGSINDMASGAYQALESDIGKVLNDTRQKVAAKFGDSKVTTNFKVQSQQHVAEIIVSDAIEWQADLIIMGAHGASGYNEDGVLSAVGAMLNPAPGFYDANTIGSVTAGVLNHAPCSVQIINYITSASTEMQDRKNLPSADDSRFLLAVNDSHSARAVIDEVVSRPWLPSATFQLIAVVEEPKSIVHSKFFKDPEIDAVHKQIYAAQKAKLEKLTEKYAEEIKAKSGTKMVQHHVLEGNVRSCIMQIAQDWGADMIMIGAHDRDKSIMECFLGSVARAVVDNADCSVEVVRMRKR